MGLEKLEGMAGTTQWRVPSESLIPNAQLMVRAGAGDSPVRQCGQIDIAMAGVVTAAEQVEKSLLDLRGWLTMVLRPELPVHPENRKEGTQEASAPLADVLFNHAQHLRRIKGIIEDINARLEL